MSVDGLALPKHGRGGEAGRDTARQGRTHPWRSGGGCRASNPCACLVVDMRASRGVSIPLCIKSLRKFGGGYESKQRRQYPFLVRHTRTTRGPWAARGWDRRRGSLYVHASIHPSIHPSIQSTHPSIHPINPSDQSTHPSTHATHRWRTQFLCRKSRPRRSCCMKPCVLYVCI